MLDFSRSHFAWGRSLWSYAKVQTAVGTLLRNRSIQLRGCSTDLLNIGCGPYAAPGFCNIDFAWRPGVIAWDITQGLPLPDGSVSGIYSEHCLEHITFEQCGSVLKDFKRLLRKGGTLRIVVPDGALYLDLYSVAVTKGRADWPYPEVGLSPMQYVNRIMRGHGHQFIYDFETLAGLLSTAGFKTIRRTAFMIGNDRRLLIDLEFRHVESLYVEAIG